MKLSVSCLAWDAAEDAAVADVLKHLGVDAIDIVPGRCFADVATATADDARRVAAAWADRGLQIAGMQALLFGTSGLNLFGNAESRAQMLAHLSRVIRLAGAMGIRALTFGSPKNRDRAGVADQEASRIAVEFFREAGDVAEEANVLFCLEPNPVSYGCNFMTTTLEAAEIVERTAHAHIRLQLDTGTMLINKEDHTVVIPQVRALIGHVHASEPALATLGPHAVQLRDILACLQQQGVSGPYTIEMLADKTQPHTAAITSAILSLRADRASNG